MIESQGQDVWTFYDFVDDRGRNVIRTWLDDLPESVAAALDATLDHLNALAPGEWRRPQVDKVQGYSDIREIRFKEEGVQWRPLICFGPEQYEVTLLIGASKRQKAWDPVNAPREAQARSTLIRGTTTKDNKHVTFHKRAKTPRDDQGAGQQGLS